MFDRNRPRSIFPYIKPAFLTRNHDTLFCIYGDASHHKLKLN
jgi:hypothetical protein